MPIASLLFLLIFMPWQSEAAICVLCDGPSTITSSLSSCYYQDTDESDGNIFCDIHDANYKCCVCNCQCVPGRVGVLCDKDQCTAADCNDRGTADGGRPDCTCSCNVPNYAGPTCNDRICHANYDCNNRGSGITGSYPNCVCSGCAAPYSGNACELALCRVDYDCNTRGSGVSGTLPNCFCTGCAAPYAGNTCNDRICHVNFDCNGRGTSIVGTYPACYCQWCAAPYSGNACELRICHKDFDCRGHGLSITGTYPDCLCQCEKYYGGRNCRTLTQTLVLVTPSETTSPSPTQSSLLSLTVSQVVTTTQTLFPTHSNSLSKTSSSSLTISTTNSSSLTPTPTVSASESITASHSVSPSTSYTSSISRSLSLSESRTWSLSTSCTQSTTSTGSRSNSESLSESSSTSLTITNTVSTSDSASATFTCREYDNLDVFDTCSVMRALPAASIWEPTPANDTLKPFVIDASWLIAKTTYNNNCTIVRVPYSRWSGRTGSTHFIAMVAVDSRIPLKTIIKPPIIDTDLVASDLAWVASLPITLLFSGPEEVINATRDGILPAPPEHEPSEGHQVNATFMYLTAVSALQYLGKNTLNKVQYDMACKEWARCPITMSGEFQVTLVASERLFPPVLAEVVNGVSIGVSIGSALSVSPSAVAQMGVTSSLRQMSRCMTTNLDDESDNDSYQDYMSGVLNPLGLVIGGNGGRRYVRGALVSSFVYAVGLCLLLFICTSVARKISHAMTSEIQNDKREGKSKKEGLAAPAPIPLLAGYPSTLIAAISFAMDGGGSTGTILAIFGAGWGDRLVGVVALLMCVGYIGHIFYVTVLKFPPALVLESLGSGQHILCQLPEEEKDEPELELDELLAPPLLRTSISDDSIATEPKMLVDSLEDSLLSRSFAHRLEETTSPAHVLHTAFRFLDNPSHEWKASANLSDGPTVWLSRYESYIADSKLTWYCGMEQGIALAICILSAAAFDEMAYCIARGSVCLLLIGAQALVMVILKPVVHRWRRILMSLVLTLQAASAALSITNAPLQLQLVELFMDIIGALVFALTAIVFVADMFVFIYRSQEQLCRTVSFLGKKLMTFLLANKAPTDSQSLEVNSRVEPYLPSESENAAPLGKNDTIPHALHSESDIIAAILRDLQDFEYRQLLFAPDGVAGTEMTATQD